MTPAPGPWEREVRRFVLSGLVFVLFLAIASLVALRMTTRWAVAQMETRLAAEARALATGVEASGDLVSGLTTDAGVVRLVREFAPLQVALFDARGSLRRSVTWLPDAARVPDGLPPEEAPRGPQARVTRGSEGGAPVVVVAVPLVSSGAVLRTVYDATPLVAAERMVRILTVVVPAGVALLVALAVPFLRRFTRPIDALAETARSADALVPPGPAGAGEPIRVFAIASSGAPTPSPSPPRPSSARTRAASSSSAPAASSRRRTLPRSPRSGSAARTSDLPPPPASPSGPSSPGRPRRRSAASRRSAPTPPAATPRAPGSAPSPPCRSPTPTCATSAASSSSRTGPP
ncbi:MAG TPA: hypothetical protein PKA62_18845 [Thermoanaerobaculia bacterium]|nr:hypothetical protein [Thermoanaerobaculia bacterium]